MARRQASEIQMGIMIACLEENPEMVRSTAGHQKRYNSGKWNTLADELNNNHNDGVEKTWQEWIDYFFTWKYNVLARIRRSGDNALSELDARLLAVIRNQERPANEAAPNAPNLGVDEPRQEPPSVAMQQPVAEIAAAISALAEILGRLAALGHPERGPN